MMLNNENKKDLRSMLKGRAVYLALSACVLAAGAISYTSSLSRLAPSRTREDETEIVTYRHVEERQLPEPTTIPEAPVAVQPPPATEPPTAQPETAAPVFDNAAKPLETTEAQTEEPSTEPAPPVFSLPLAFRAGKTYSMGAAVFSQTMGDYRTHNGVDFPGATGEAVRAAAEGTVTNVTKSPLFGNVVTVDHGNGYETRTAGLADAGLARVGDAVTAETVIGLVGEIPAEKEEGSHVHFELRVNGRLADPLDYLDVPAQED